MGGTRVRIGISLGATLNVDGQDWIKPSLYCDVLFDEMPDEEELRERWDWLLETQIVPQSEALVQMILEKRGLVPNESTRSVGTPRKFADPVSDGEVYG